MPTIKIPKDRIGVLIGEGGKTKMKIEEVTGTTLDIDSKTGVVEIDTREVEDPVLKLKVEDIIRAIGRGFNPKKALSLVDDEIYFELMDIRSYVGKSSNAVHRMKARIIGKEGRTRELIEELSESYVSVYGNTVAIIGSSLELSIARRAIQMILEGAEHSSVYSYLESKRTDIKRRRQGFF